MSTGAELWQHLCADTIKKSLGLNPFNPPGYASAYWYLNGYGVKQIHSSILPAVCHLIITTDV